MSQQTFTRKEVTALLKKQKARSVNSFGLMQIPTSLARHKDYMDEVEKVFKRLKNVTLIKF